MRNGDQKHKEEEMTINYMYPKNGGTEWNAKSFAVGTHYSDKIIHRHAGEASMLMKVSGGQATLTYELSETGEANDWYEPYDTGGSRANNIVQDLGSNRLITFTPAFGKYIRFKLVVAGATSVVTARYGLKEG